MIGDRPQPLLALHAHIGVSAHVHAEVAMEGFDTPYRLFWLYQAVDRRFFIIAFVHDVDERSWQEIN